MDGVYTNELSGTEIVLQYYFSNQNSIDIYADQLNILITVYIKNIHVLLNPELLWKISESTCVKMDLLNYANSCIRILQYLRFTFIV